MLSSLTVSTLMPHLLLLFVLLMMAVLFTARALGTLGDRSGTSRGAVSLLSWGTVILFMYLLGTNRMPGLK